MNLKLLSLSLAILSAYNNEGFATTKTPPKLQYASLYHEDIDINKFWVSEKLDGVRAYWNGRQLLTRRGNIIRAPNWFTASLPNIALDGELWIAHRKFELVSGIIRKINPDDKEWQDVRYKVFDLPRSLQPFNNRKIILEKLIANINKPYIQLVKQDKVSTINELRKKLAKIIAKGGEGLMLHKGTSLYQAKRTNDLLKFKRYQDAEATVIAHLPGKGKFKGMMGAILVETKNGVRFKIGSGFSQKERISPPEPGSTITFRYRGKTNKGIPRFASFLRTRDDY